MREALALVRDRLVAVIDQLGRFARQYRELACLAFTHLQPAQPTTVGKRACLWAYDLVLDLEEIEHRMRGPWRLGSKGTTGTQASFLELFQGDHAKVRLLEELIAEKIGFAGSYAVTGQTYPRKIDSQVLAVLSGIAQSAHKMATDLRLLQHRKEVEEPFEDEQIGSSAMAYKRNPMRSERICSLARFVISLESSAAMTAATQWLERTLDDSANRRLVLPQAFLAADALLILDRNVAAGLVVYPQGDRQGPGGGAALHGHGEHSHGRRGRRRRPAGPARADPPSQPGGRGGGQGGRRAQRSPGPPGRRSGLRQGRLRAALDPAGFVGRAPQQVDEFLADVVEPIRKKYPQAVGMEGEVSV